MLFNLEIIIYYLIKHEYKVLKHGPLNMWSLKQRRFWHNQFEKPQFGQTTQLQVNNFKS